MSDGPCCTHQTVRLTPHIHDDGSRTDHWRCECGQVFVIPGVEAEAARQAEQELSEAYERIRLLAALLTECADLINSACPDASVWTDGLAERVDEVLP